MARREKEPPVWCKRLQVYTYEQLQVATDNFKPSYRCGARAFVFITVLNFPFLL